MIKNGHAWGFSPQKLAEQMQFGLFSLFFLGSQRPAAGFEPPLWTPTPGVGGVQLAPFFPKPAPFLFPGCSKLHCLHRSSLLPFKAGLFGRCPFLLSRYVLQNLVSTADISGPFYKNKNTNILKQFKTNQNSSIMKNTRVATFIFFLNSLQKEGQSSAI